MFSDESGRRSALIILLLLPAPLTAIAIMLGLVLVIADTNTVNIDLSGDGDKQVQLAPQPTNTISPEVAALATVNAAPNRPAFVRDPGDAAVALGYDETLVKTGQVNFLGTCAGCHGTDAHGITGLGKPLIESEFVRSLDDQQLLEFVTNGRQPYDPANTTGVQMPPRGGNPGLTDEDLLSIIAYIRTLDGFAPEPGTTVAAAATPVPEDTTPISTEPVVYVRPDVGALLDSLGIVLEAPQPTPDRDGEAAFESVCGTRYEDLLTVRPDYCDVLIEMVVNGASQDDLFTLIQKGSPIWDENNTTGVHFPARGGYPPLNDAEITNFIGYLQQIATE